jgi:hypothetical protein
LGAGICAGVEQALPTAPEATNKSYRIDETYIKVWGQGKYLYQGWIRPDRRLSFYLRPNAMRCCQGLPPQGDRGIGQSNASGEERGQEPGISGCIGSAES